MGGTDLSAFHIILTTQINHNQSVLCAVINSTSEIYALSVSSVDITYWLTG